MGYEIEWEPPDGVLKRHFGHVTGEEVLEAVQRTEEDPRFDALHYAINDFRDCTSLAVSPVTVQEVAAVDCAAAHSNARIRVAIVTTRSDVKAMSNAYANDPLTRFDTRIFETMEDARRWVGQAGN